MVFFDKKERDLEEEVYTIKKIKTVPTVKEGEEVDFHLVRALQQTQGEGFYRTQIKHIGIGEPIMDVDGMYISRRIE